jgi:hypothetical protein
MLIKKSRATLEARINDANPQEKRRLERAVKHLFTF